MSRWGAVAPEHKPTGLWFYSETTGQVGEQVFVDAHSGVMTLRQPNGEEVVASSLDVKPITREVQNVYNSGLQDALNDCEYIEPAEFPNVYRRGYRSGCILSGKGSAKLDAIK